MERPKTTLNHLKIPTTTSSHLQPPQKFQQPPKTTYKHLQPSTITSATRKLSKTI